MAREGAGNGTKARLGAWATTLLLALGAAVSACKDSTNPAPVPAAIRTEVADTMTGVVGTTLDSVLKVLVVDNSGTPIAGTSVAFASSAGGAISPAVALTNDQGVAEAAYTFGTAAGTIVITASDSTATPAMFHLTALPGAPSLMAALGGDGQSAAAGTQLALPMVVQVTDQYSNPVAGVTVTWSTSGAGSLTSTSSQTDASGKAQTTLTLDAAAGPQTVTAAANGVSSLVFTATGT